MPEPSEPMWRRYLRFFGPNVKGDIDEELGFHFTERIDELRAQGLAPDAAHRQALAEFGDVPAIRAELHRIDREAHRRRRRRVSVTTAVGGLGLDLRFAFRTLRVSPGLVVAAAGSLAVAVAINVTMFAAADLVAFRPFNVPEPERLVSVPSTIPARGWTTTPASLLDFYDWRDGAQTVELAADQSTGFNWADGTRAEWLSGARVTAGFFAIHRVPTVGGREFTRADETSGVPIAIIDDRFGRNAYGRADSALGKTIVLDGMAHTIVGIVPANYEFPRLAAEVWVPLMLALRDGRGSRSVWPIGRLRGGASVAGAQAELGAMAARQEQSYPGTNRGIGVRVQSAIDSAVSPEARRAAWALLVAVWLVLLIACANVANLLLARTAGRTREIAIRSAVVAGRGRIIRLLLVESAVLAAIGGVLGLGLSVAGLAWLKEILGSNNVGGLAPVGLSGRLFLVALLVTAGAALMVGLLPALRSAGDVTARLRDGGRSETSGRSRSRSRAALVAAELAMAVVLVVGAGLMIKGNYRAARVDLGIDAGQGISFTTFLPEQGYPDSAAILRFQDRLAEQLRAIPKVETVGFGSTLPFDGSSRTPYSVDAPAADSARDLAYAQLHSVSDGYFGALGIKVSRGRPFAAIDHFGAPWVALVNERLAAVHWPGADPVGHRLWFRDRDWTVVGVVANVREWGVLDEAPAAIYVAASQSPTRWVSFAVRAQRGIDQLGPEARAAVAAVAPRQPIARLQSLAWQAARARREPRLLAEMFGLLGAIAILGCPQPTGQPRAAPASRPCRS